MTDAFDALGAAAYDQAEEENTRLEEQYEAALGEAADLAGDLLADLKSKTGVFGKFLETQRIEAIEAMKTLIDIDAGDIEAVRRIQTTLAVYRSAIGFAQKVLDRYSAPEPDSGGTESGGDDRGD